MDTSEPGPLSIRYAAGDRIDVWHELHELGSLRSVSESVRVDAKAVAEMTIERAIFNLERIYERLRAMNFAWTQIEEIPDRFVRASPQSLDAREFFIETHGTLPLTLDAFLRRIASVCFRGRFASWDEDPVLRSQLFDPFEFVFECSREILKGDLDYYRAQEAELEADANPDDVPMWRRLEFAGDYLHKNDISGGLASFVILPSDAADARVRECEGPGYGSDFVDGPGGTDLWFVDYLRRYFLRGGFRRVPIDSPDPDAIFERLADGLLPI